MGSKNACALEFAWILARNIKCSVNILIVMHVFPLFLGHVVFILHSRPIVHYLL